MDSPPLSSTILAILAVVFFLGFIGNVGSNGGAAIVSLVLFIACAWGWKMRRIARRSCAKFRRGSPG